MVAVTALLVILQAGDVFIRYNDRGLPSGEAFVRIPLREVGQAPVAIAAAIQCGWLW